MEMQDKQIRVVCGDGTVIPGRVSHIGKKFTEILFTIHGSDFVREYANQTVERAYLQDLRLRI